jgi:hypothetical protein
LLTAFFVIGLSYFVILVIFRKYFFFF